MPSTSQRVQLLSHKMPNGNFNLQLRWRENGVRKKKSCGLGSFEVDPLEGSNSRRKGIREAVQQAEKMRADREAVLIATERGWKVQGAKDPTRGRVETFLDYMRAGRDSNTRAWKNRFNIVMRRLEEFYCDPKVGLDDPRFEELTLGHGNTFRDWLKRGDANRKPYDAESVRNYITLVKSELERAVEMEVLAANPWRQNLCRRLRCRRLLCRRPIGHHLPCCLCLLLLRKALFEIALELDTRVENLGLRSYFRASAQR